MWHIFERWFLSLNISMAKLAEERNIFQMIFKRTSFFFVSFTENIETVFLKQKNKYINFSSFQLVCLHRCVDISCSCSVQQQNRNVTRMKPEWLELK